MSIASPPISTKTRGSIQISRRSQSIEPDLAKEPQEHSSATESNAAKVIAQTDYHAKEQLVSEENKPSPGSSKPTSESSKTLKVKIPYVYQSPAKLLNLISESTSYHDVPPPSSKLPYQQTRASILRQKAQAQKILSLSKTASVRKAPSRTPSISPTPSESATPSLLSDVSENTNQSKVISLLPKKVKKPREKKQITLIKAESEESFSAQVGPVQTARVIMHDPTKLKDSSSSTFEEGPKLYKVVYKVGPTPDDIFKVNTVLMARWAIVDKMRFGRHVQKFKAFDQDLTKRVVVKATTNKHYSLDRESQLLKALELRTDIYKFIAYEDSEMIPYLVTEMEGPSLDQLKSAYGPLSLSSVIHLGIKMVNALQALHARGWMHTDISPDSFTIGILPEKWRTVTLNDYGLARKTLRGKLPKIAPDNRSEMYSDPQFASISVLNGKEFDKSDDLWSILYVILHIKSDTLPWSSLSDLQSIKNAKKTKLNQVIVKHLGATFKGIVSLLNQINFGDRPDYDKIMRIFENTKKYYTIQESIKFEWECDPDRIFEPDSRDPALSVKK